jgi:hypothetical protein
MVRHGTQKKRRAGKKVTRKGPKNKNLKIMNALTDIKVKEHWDNRKSPHENFASMGLDYDPNNLKKEGFSKEAAFEGFITMPVTEDVTDHNPRRRPMSTMDQEYIVKCVRKHKTDFHKMAMDIKTNSMQLTEARLKKMFEKYSSLPDDQKDVEL